MDTQEFYNLIDSYVLELKTINQIQHADKLDFLVHKVAWTTGSELLEEIDLVMEKIIAEEVSTSVTVKAKQLSKLARMIGNF